VLKVHKMLQYSCQYLVECQNVLADRCRARKETIDMALERLRRLHRVFKTRREKKRMLKREIDGVDSLIARYDATLKIIRPDLARLVKKNTDGSVELIIEEDTLTSQVKENFDRWQRELDYYKNEAKSAQSVRKQLAHVEEELMHLQHMREAMQKSGGGNVVSVGVQNTGPLESPRFSDRSGDAFNMRMGSPVQLSDMDEIVLGNTPEMYDTTSSVEGGIGLSETGENGLSETGGVEMSGTSSTDPQDQTVVHEDEVVVSSSHIQITPSHVHPDENLLASSEGFTGSSNEMCRDDSETKQIQLDKHSSHYIESHDFEDSQDDQSDFNGVLTVDSLLVKQTITDELDENTLESGTFDGRLTNDSLHFNDAKNTGHVAVDSLLRKQTITGQLDENTPESGTFDGRLTNDSLQFNDAKNSGHVAVDSLQSRETRDDDFDVDSLGLSGHQYVETEEKENYKDGGSSKSSSTGGVLEEQKVFFSGNEMWSGDEEEEEDPNREGEEDFDGDDRPDDVSQDVYTDKDDEGKHQAPDWDMGAMMEMYPEAALASNPPIEAEGKVAQLPLSPTTTVGAWSLLDVIGGSVADGAQSSLDMTISQSGSQGDLVINDHTGASNFSPRSGYSDASAARRGKSLLSSPGSGFSSDVSAMRPSMMSPRSGISSEYSPRQRTDLRSPRSDASLVSRGKTSYLLSPESASKLSDTSISGRQKSLLSPRSIKSRISADSLVISEGNEEEDSVLIGTMQSEELEALKLEALYQEHEEGVQVTEEEEEEEEEDWFFGLPRSESTSGAVIVSLDKVDIFQQVDNIGPRSQIVVEIVPFGDVVIPTPPQPVTNGTIGTLRLNQTISLNLKPGSRFHRRMLSLGLANSGIEIIVTHMHAGEEDHTTIACGSISCQTILDNAHYFEVDLKSPITDKVIAASTLVIRGLADVFR